MLLRYVAMLDSDIEYLQLQLRYFQGLFR